MLTLPGNTYVPSRVYVLLEAGYGGSFIPALSPHGNINRVWTASSADEPAYGDFDRPLEPNPDDVGGEWTSSLLAALDQLLRVDDLAIRAWEFSREYIPINMAGLDSLAFNSAFLNGMSHPASYSHTEHAREGLQEKTIFLARWARSHHDSRGNLEERIALNERTPCVEFFWILEKMARHDALLPPAPEFDLHDGKSAARDLSHSDWWDYCALFWEVFAKSE